MIESNSLIKASAGTGKTFALATRFIRQLMIDGVDPKSIVALTFSRAAAQEIYTKILMRLCAAAQDDAGAEREWQTLLEDFRRGLVPLAAEKLAQVEAKRIPHGAADFRRCLRELVETQHLGAIATLDSFILRIVKNFPKEMGFQNAVEVLDPADESAAVEDAVRGVLARADGVGSGVAQAFQRTQDGKLPRTCLAAIVDILIKGGWRNFVIDHPESVGWTVESMCAELGVSMTSECPDLSMLKDRYVVIGTGKEKSSEELFVDFVVGYDGSVNPLEAQARAVALMTYFQTHPEATEYCYVHRNHSYRFDCGAEGAAAIRAAIRHVINVYLKRQLEVVKAKIELVQAVEGDYERMTRRAGKLTFADFTKFSAEEEFSERGIAIQNVQFRFDSQFDHWALDEFQDTSELQWKCLRELVRNVADAGAGGEERSVMAVGDMKQSIYTWRGASAAPFEELSAWGSMAGMDRDFKLSHRYGPNTVEFVNRVFGRDNIKCGGIIPAACDDAVEEWSAGWVDHESHEPADYVKVIGVKASAAGGGDEDDDAMLKALYVELQGLWERHQAVGSRETVGVLVRNNDDGLKVAEYLRNRGMQVVWEGMSPIHDLPVVEAVLALLRLGDHPEDRYAWRTVNDLFQVREWVLPEGLTAAQVSAQVSRRLTRQGLSRTLKEFCGSLRERGGLEPNGLAQERLKQLVEMGVDYETRANGGDIDGFVRFLSQAQQRELAVSPDVVRILSIHRSKGLGIDHVFVPLFEKDRSRSAIDAPSVRTPLYDGGNWVLPHLKKGSEGLNAKTQAAFESLRAARLRESLRTYYVALTRSKRSLFVICPDDSNSSDFSKGLLMRDLIVSAVGPDLPFALGEPPTFASAAAAAVDVRRRWADAGERTVVERSSPSRASHDGGNAPAWMKVSALFAADYGEAAQHGVEVHAAYQRVEWADAEQAAKLQPAFREAFVKQSENATVWRERSYELFNGRQWETGQFDRVVFAGTGTSRMATIYDFKTNARGKGESESEFAQRLREQYAGQMTAYRQALSKLTGIPETKIVTKLLAESTGAVIEVGQ